VAVQLGSLSITVTGDVQSFTERHCCVASIIDTFSINDDGSLTQLPSSTHTPDTKMRACDVIIAVITVNDTRRLTVNCLRTPHTVLASAPAYRQPHSQPFRSQTNSLRGVNRPIGPWPIHSLAILLPRSRSLAFSLPGAKWPRNFRSLEVRDIDL